MNGELDKVGIKTHTLRIRSKDDARGSPFEMEVFLDDKPLHRITELRVTMLTDELLRVDMSMVVDMDVELALEEGDRDHACVVCHRYISPDRSVPS